MKKLEKDRLIEFVAKVMEESGFKVYKNFKTSRHVIDVYGILPTVLGDMGIVVACKNYDEQWEVGLDVLKEMEMIGKTLKASKIVVITTSHFTKSAINYAGRRNIKLIDKDGLLVIAKKFSKKVEAVNSNIMSDDYVESDNYDPMPRSFMGPLIQAKGKKSLSRSRKKQNIGKSTHMGDYVPDLKGIMNNTLALILIVLLVSSFITYIISLFNKDTAIIGVSRILFSALLSYGLVLYSERDMNVVLTKGTIIFFASMIIYVILILITR